MPQNNSTTISRITLAHGVTAEELTEKKKRLRPHSIISNTFQNKCSVCEFNTGMNLKRV